MHVGFIIPNFHVLLSGSVAGAMEPVCVFKDFTVQSGLHLFYILLFAPSPIIVLEHNRR